MSNKIVKKIAIACDHAGVDLKEHLKKVISYVGAEGIDLGTDSQKSVDYPDYAAKVAEMINSGRADQGILICGTGVGMAISANKVSGIRCVVCSEVYSAVLSRQHNDTNVLALGARVIGFGLAEMIVKEWLAAEFEGGRHQTRVDKITGLEK